VHVNLLNVSVSINNIRQRTAKTRKHATVYAHI